ncbi:MAG: chorismate mutase [Myxococcota bacterium]
MSRDDELERLRAVIDAVDDRLLALLAERAAAVRELWALKAAGGVAQRDPTREAEIRERLLRRAEHLGLDPAAVSRVLDAVIGQKLFR